MNGGFVTIHYTEAVKAFFGPYQQNDHVKLYRTHLQVLDMERVDCEMREVLKRGKLFPVVFK